MKSPKKLSHVILRTGQLDTMRDWYADVLNARVVFQNPRVAFLAYDEEHHRIGFLSIDDAVARDAKAAGLEHMAFGYNDLGDLLAAYEALADRAISPSSAINHGSTTSLYYKDPDGNEVELMIENFSSHDEANAFVASDAFRKTPHGRAFDPRAYLQRLRQGESQAMIVTWPSE